MQTGSHCGNQHIETTWLSLKPYTDVASNLASDCWRFYAVPRASIIFTAKTGLDVFSLSREQVFLVLGDRI